MLDISISQKLNNFTLSISKRFDSGIYAIVGNNGTGKSTFLKIIAGLEKANAKVVFDGVVWQDKDIFLPPYKRDIGFVFQDIALFPNMNLLQNLLYANNNIKFATFLIKLLQLKHIKNSNIDSLSGGEKQKIAIARAFMRKSKLILLDEPFSALDKDIKPIIYDSIKLYQKRFNATILIVTHDLDEAKILTNNIIDFIPNYKN